MSANPKEKRNIVMLSYVYYQRAWLNYKLRKVLGKKRNKICHRKAKMLSTLLFLKIILHLKNKINTHNNVLRGLKLKYYFSNLKENYVPGQTIILREAGWPHRQCARLRIEWSGFESWLGTLCCVLGQGTLLSRCLSPPSCINGYRRI